MRKEATPPGPAPSRRRSWLRPLALLVVLLGWEALAALFATGQIWPHLEATFGAAL